MQVVPMCKMIVLIILPVPLNEKWTKYWTVPFLKTIATTLHI